MGDRVEGLAKMKWNEMKWNEMKWNKVLVSRPYERTTSWVMLSLMSERLTILKNIKEIKVTNKSREYNMYTGRETDCPQESTLRSRTCTDLNNGANQNPSTATDNTQGGTTWSRCRVSPRSTDLRGAHLTGRVLVTPPRADDQSTNETTNHHPALSSPITDTWHSVRCTKGAEETRTRTA